MPGLVRMFMRRLLLGLALLFGSMLVLGVVAAQSPVLRQRVKAVVRPEPPPPITPLAATVPSPRPSLPSLAPTFTASALPTAPPPTRPPQTAAPAHSPLPPTLVPSATSSPAPTATAGPVQVNGRLYDAYVPAALKAAQDYQYSCEFDAAWVIFATYGIPVSVDELVAAIGQDTRVEPYIEETAEGFIIRGGDIGSRFSGDYRNNFLARSTGRAMRPVFERYGLAATPVGDRASVEVALRAGQLVWMKTTVDFQPWRPATWITPDGERFQTVLGNDHAVVVIGFNAEVVVIRDVLGPTSSNWERPYEYEVGWETFLRTWEAQAYDGLAVAPPAGASP